MNALDLIATARDLVHSRSGGKPRQSNLLRAESTAYYALFHMLARCCADLLIGGKSSSRNTSAWNQVYRALDHGPAKTACENTNKMASFPAEIQDFANMFITMQAKRHKADYDPTERLYKSQVIIDIDLVEQSIDTFKAADIKNKRAFAAHVLLRPRKF